MRFRYGGTTLDLKLASAKAWAFCGMMLFVFSTVYFLSQVRHGGKRSQTLDVDEAVAALPQHPDPLNLDHQPPRKAIEKPMKHRYKGLRFDDELNDVVMAMDAVRNKYQPILTKQQDILKEQVRPPDSHYNINVTLSDRISMDRNILDTRPPVCKTFHYEKDLLGKASVIIPFYNEALSMLLRTVHSVLNRSPDDLLHEVILVDDCSTREYLQGTLTEYINLLPKTRIIRNKGREGLIKSRLIGSRSTSAPVVIFLDAHTEANVGWLEPLLDELRRHPSSVIQPFVDGIEALTIEYSSPPSLHKGVFSWDLGYRWQKLTEHESARSTETGYPFFSPTLVGCAIAVNKKYFEHIGEFDEGLKVWGGENIELAFRVWMCGGRVVTVICSRVGHVFKNFPYKFDGDREKIVSKNLMRVTEVWMDGFRKYYYASSRTYDFKRTELDQDDLRSLAERIELRKRLQCQNFEWYMHNIMPDIDVPPMESVYYGEIGNIRTKACWELTPDYYVGMNYLCYEHKIIPKNLFYINHIGQLKYKEKCIRFQLGKPALRLGECPAHNEDQTKYGTWEMQNMGQVWGLLKVKIKNKNGAMETFCVVQVTNVFVAEHPKSQMPQLTRCNDKDEFQKWVWTYHFDWSQVPNRLNTMNGIGKKDNFISES